ncbi:avidin/streptavidin family protein [uncultured Shewanella sp.]|uniref:avidin/streptavidin family protein n=1 Tax=uncultured Shewanella sp. TaxID=173975 RepID=UPI002614F54F|nr:avidin/streptavidin family protein [uncultured Shewanella sp.]
MTQNQYLLFIVFIISLFSALITSTAKSTQDSTVKKNAFLGAWYNFNPHGCSSMYITQASETGQLTGAFANGQTGWCAKPEQWFNLTGQMIGKNAVQFKVNWQNNIQNCQSITTWDGEIKDDVLYTNWVLSSTNGEKIYRGEDTFYRECKCSHCPTP